MRIGVIVASSQAEKNAMLYEAVRKYAVGADVVNFGCFPEAAERYSYIEISLLAGMLLASGSVDFIVTGCSSGQGMMLACNSFPGMLCGYAPTPMDAFLFAQINDGNAVSLPLGEGYTWTGPDNLNQTIAKLFSEPFGQGYPKAEAERKLRDTALLKEIRCRSQVNVVEFLNSLDESLVEKLLTKRDVIDDMMENGRHDPLLSWLAQKTH